jgi:hypothetical protein
MAWYNNVPSNQVLDNWIKYKYNVLFHGRHGVGKTSMIFDAFKRANWELGRDFLYFSAATIDPWVDLIGVPARVKNEDGEEVLKLIRPESIHNKTIKAFFVDELNRSHKKVRNALMELIQFKSINGLKFPNLDIVWAAVNPDEDDVLKFDVEKLDPAQEDRFQIQVQIPYEPSESYFSEKFNNPEMAEAVCKWWKGLADNVKPTVTPRRLEYAIDVYRNTGDLRYVLPIEANASVLKNAIETGNPEKMLKRLIAAGESAEPEIRKWLAIENNLNAVQNMICTERQVCAKVLHLLSEERLVSFATKHKVVIDQLKAEPKKYERIIRDLAKNSTQKMLKETCAKLIPHLDSADKLAENISIPTKSPSALTLTKRKKAQIFANYRINKNESISLVGNPPANIVQQISVIATECSFASNSMQRADILQKLGEVVYPSMSKQEADICVRMVESVAGYLTGDEYIIKYLPVINTCVAAWSTANNTVSTEALFKVAPYLVTNILINVADNPSKYNIGILEKHDNKTLIDIPDEIDNKQSVEALF